MEKNIQYYISKGFDEKTAAYFASGRKSIKSVSPNADFTLTLVFNNGETRIFDCKPLLADGTVFAPFMRYNNFKRVYLDSAGSVCWDIDPNVDSNTVWNNKIDLCPDSCYIDSVPVAKA